MTTTDGADRISLPRPVVHLPGGLTRVTIDGPPVVNMVTHDKARTLHGILSDIIHIELGEPPHTPDSAAIAIIPRTDIRSWDVWWARSEYLVFANQRRVVSWQTNRSRRAMHIGPVIRLRHPAMPSARHYFVTLRTCTPLVVMTANPSALVKKFTGEHMKSVLRNVAKRIDMETTPLGDVRVMEQDLYARTCPRYHGCGQIGVMGSLVIRMDHQALWLLRVAEMIGFGGSTSIGYGRFLIKDVV